jgi:hypothetical protein
MVDRIAREEGIAMNTIQSKSLLGVGTLLPLSSTVLAGGRHYWTPVILAELSVVRRRTIWPAWMMIPLHARLCSCTATFVAVN